VNQVVDPLDDSTYNGTCPTTIWSRSTLTLNNARQRCLQSVVAIAWPLDALAGSEPLLAEKDSAAPTLVEALAGGRCWRDGQRSGYTSTVAALERKGG
jgi:hypothetical protein